MEITVREKAEPFAPVIALLLLLVGAAVFGLYLGWALMAGAILFTLDAKRHGRTWGQVGNMLAQGLKKAWIVVQVLLVIGLLTASWISCGAIPCLVRLGALVIRPHVFLLCTFWLCAVMSFLLGTSFGTANTMGVVMMTLGTSGRGEPSHDRRSHPVRHLRGRPVQSHVLLPAPAVHVDRDGTV